MHLRNNETPILNPFINDIVITKLQTTGFKARLRQIQKRQNSEAATRHPLEGNKEQQKKKRIIVKRTVHRNRVVKLSNSDVLLH